MAEKNKAKSQTKPKSALNATHKSMLAGAGGALVALVIMLGTFGVVHAMHGHDGRAAFKASAPMMREGSRGEGMFGRMGQGGEITKIDGNTITLKGGDDQVITINVDDNTNYQKDGGDAKLTDLKVGDKIMVRGDVTSTTIDADAIGIRQ